MVRDVALAEAAGFGKPPEAARPRMMLRSWKRIDPRKPGSSLVGFASIALPIGPTFLDVDELPILETNGIAWAAWPARPVITEDGRVATLPGSSKRHYVSLIRWRDRATSQRFSHAVVELVKAADPSAFDERRGS
jgi:hypothetical protein